MPFICLLSVPVSIQTRMWQSQSRQRDPNESGEQLNRDWIMKEGSQNITIQRDPMVGAEMICNHEICRVLHSVSHIVIRVVSLSSDGNKYSEKVHGLSIATQQI